MNRRPRQPDRAKPKRPSRAQVPAEFTDAARGKRLQKVLAEAGIASRRDAEALITAGRVTVNGQRITALPAWADPLSDRIEVDGEPIARPRKAGHGHAAPQHVYIALHKPRRVISTSRDEAHRTSVVDLVDLPSELARRVFPVGRLDADSTGLILLTNDGELANRLTHPRYGVSKEYLVSIRGHLSLEDVEKLKKGLYLAPTPAEKQQRGPESAAKRAAISEVKLLGYDRDEQRGDRTKLLLTLREGQNREIRRLMARLGYNVRRLQRVAIGPITIKGLASGSWRLLHPTEVHKLKKAAGL